MMYTPGKFQQRYENGFTLIELLVVISIVAMLISILLPALGSARDAARSMVCMSNQRQIAMAMFGYAAENREYMVPSQMNAKWNTIPAAPYNSTSPPRHMWPALLKHLDYMPGGLSRTDSTWDIFACSAAPNARGLTDNDIPGWHTYFISYGYNWAQIGASMDIIEDSVLDSDGNEVRAYTPARQHEIVDASSKLLLVDTLQVDSNANIMPRDPHRGYNRVAASAAAGAGNLGRPDPRHSGGVNIVWVDGHASSLLSPDPMNYGSIYGVLGNGGVGATGPNVWNREDKGKVVR